MIDAFLYWIMAAAQASAPAAPAKPATLQAQFDAANAAYEERRCIDAIKLYDELAVRTAKSSNALLGAAIQVRKGICVSRGGDGATAAVLIRQGLPTLAKSGVAFAADVRDAYIALGNAAFEAFDYDTAAASYRDALAIATGQERIAPLLALSRTLAFDRDGKALAYAQEARDLATQNPTIGKELVALIQTRYARVLLNEGKKEEAYTFLKDSLKKQGGLDQKVSMSEVQTRADLALAALLNGDRDRARMYLAYTGAGRMKDDAFGTPTDMEPAACGATTGLRPDDFAVVEFSISDAGVVRAVTPIYTTGGRAVALAFARAVSDWSWAPSEAVKIPAFFRNATRLELRCSTAVDRPRVDAPIKEAFVDWLRTQDKAPDWADLTPARALALVRADVARARAANDRPRLFTGLVWLAESSITIGAERIPAAAEAIELAKAMRAPVPVMTYLYNAQIDADIFQPDASVRARRALLARPEVNADPLSAATIRMILAGRTYPPAPKGEAEQLVADVIASPLPDTHPLKIAALLRRADLLAQGGDPVQARAAFDRTGLSSDQCALIAPTPIMQRNGASSDLYPTDAFQMGFEGWAQVEFDIAADGKTLTRRTIVAYPPFVFGDAAQKIIAASRYRSSFRPEGNTACSANKIRINFRLPH